MRKGEQISYFGYLYLHENMTAEQIANDTGYSINTVKHYLSIGQFRKNTYYSNEELDGIRKPEKKKKKYKILSKDEMMEMFKMNNSNK